MNNRSIALLASTLVATSASLAIDSFKPALANTTFRCITNTTRGIYSTIAIRSNGTPTSPLFNWERTDFAPSGYTPQRRCNEVTRRLSNAVSQNGGLLSQLWLTTGRVNAQPVVCYIRGGDSGCNGSNILFTISPSSPHHRNPNGALNSLVNFSLTGAGSAIEETSGQQYVSLEKLVEAGANASQNSSNPPVPQLDPVQPNPTTPVNPPVSPNPTTPVNPPVSPNPTTPVNPPVNNGGGI